MTLTIITKTCINTLQGDLLSMNNLPKISLNQFKQLAKAQWRNRHVKLKPLFICSPHGVGKTQSSRQIAAELSEETGIPFETVVLIGSVLEAPDLNGLPHIVNGRTEYGRPHFLPSEGAGVLLIDEATRCAKDIQNALISLIEDREINGHKLGKDWLIILAGNPKTESGTGPRYDTKEFDSALQDRVATYLLEPKRSEVLDYLKTKHGAANKVVSWMLCEPEIISLDGTKQTTPRSMEYLIKAFQVHQNEDPFLVAAGQIGQEAAVAFVNFLSNPHVLKLEQLLNITPAIKEIILATQKDANNLGTLNYWGDTFIEYLKSEAKKRDKEDFVDLAKHADLLGKTVDFMTTIESYEWLTHFINQLTDIFEQDADKIEYQLRQIHSQRPEAFKKAMSNAMQNETNQE